MNARTYLKRLAAGVALLAALLALLFSVVGAIIPRWGAGGAEQAAPLPGDQLLADPQLTWTNAVTIDAPPGAAWPWIAQLGDERAGFYSYTAIENRVGALTGDPTYAVVYRNADRIVPAWQQPRPGDSLIKGILQVRDVQPGAWLLGATPDGAPFGWTWVWQLTPLSDGTQTRLLVRMRIQTPSEIDNPVVAFLMSNGGFVMQQRMLNGIRLRAEGGVEPGWAEPAEFAAWGLILVCGMIAAWRFVVQPDWRRPLAVALASVVALFVVTYLQPELWIRAMLIIGLAVGIGWARQRAAGAGALRAAIQQT